MKLLSFIFLFTFFTKTFAQEEMEIRSVLDAQVECWNAGDLECYMDGYWRSDKLLFVGSTGPTYGWTTTLENYKKRYPNIDAMGKLTFDISSVEPLSDEFWFVVGKFSIERKNGNPSGYFTLIFRKIDGEWVIVSDHTD
ncbi:MAG: nuclear transport factor 2 family protein [Cyclobacteriaceae bacterium]